MSVFLFILPDVYRHTEKFSHQMVEKQRPYSNKIRLIKERFAINIAAITYSVKIR